MSIISSTGSNTDKSTASTTHTLTQRLTAAVCASILGASLVYFAGFSHIEAVHNAAHLIVETFQVLDVDRSEDVDAGGEQFLNVLPALGVATAGGVAVGQFVHQHQGRPGREQACLLYTSPSPRDGLLSRMPSSA